MSAMFNICRDEWGWIGKNPSDTVKKPSAGKPRRRGISQDEIDNICAALKNMAVGVQVEPMFLLSIETGMRLGEILSIKWGDVSEKTVTLVDTKNGDRRKVPLSAKAREIMESRKGIDPISPFTLTQHVSSQTFARARNSAGCNDVHFHDARSEAITRLSKKLDVLQLAKMIGHRDIKSLMFYYAETAEDMADRL